MAGSAEVILDFSQPWRMSDVVLLVEEQRMHVHQSILAMWSTVFEEMFNELRKKNSRALHLEGVKAHEMRELLLFIYPTISRPINEDNCYCLLELAKRFKMGKVTEDCEEYLMRTTKKGSDAINMLVLASKYGLKRLRDDCLHTVKKLNWSTIRSHEAYEEIALPDYRTIAEQIIKNLQNELSEQKYKTEELEDEVESLLPRGKPVSTGRVSPMARQQSPERLRPVSPNPCTQDSIVKDFGMDTPHPGPPTHDYHSPHSTETSRRDFEASPKMQRKFSPPTPTHKTSVKSTEGLANPKLIHPNFYSTSKVEKKSSCQRAGQPSPQTSKKSSVTTEESSEIREKFSSFSTTHETSTKKSGFGASFSGDRYQPTISPDAPPKITLPAEDMLSSISGPAISPIQSKYSTPAQADEALSTMPSEPRASPRMQRKYSPTSGPSSYKQKKHLQVTLSSAANTTKGASLPATKSGPPVPKRTHPVKPQPIIKEF
ncbi:proteoglycan 4 [Nematostella vectensis]|uniref:proteoglycan 4 n=1 Tax=Nematostella vectensis TaxID=45351 RepID=UPI0020777675|nr:proteoglycan 4 [Nematostella vectensis]